MTGGGGKGGSEVGRSEKRLDVSCAERQNATTVPHGPYHLRLPHDDGEATI